MKSLVQQQIADALAAMARQIAQQIAARLPVSDAIDKVEIAGPGFLNFFVASAAMTEVVGRVLAAQERYGHGNIGQGQRLQVEFVSANPTGPLHVGHGRGAAYGAALANVLSAAGFEVQREYYINDAGRQMDILALSTWLRYLQLHGQECPFPAKGYQGDYVRDMAQSQVPGTRSICRPCSTACRTTRAARTRRVRLLVKPIWMP